MSYNISKKEWILIYTKVIILFLGDNLLAYRELSSLKSELKRLRKLVRESEGLVEELSKQRKKLKEQHSHFIRNASDFENWIDKRISKNRTLLYGEYPFKHSLR